MGKAPIYPQPVNITSSESINRPKVSLRNDFFLPIPDHQLIEETMASIHDQLQCCLLFPRTNGKKHQQHTRDPRRRQTKHCRSQHKNKGRLFQLIHVFQWKIGVSDKRNCHQSKNTQIKSTFVEIKLSSRHCCTTQTQLRTS